MKTRSLFIAVQIFASLTLIIDPSLLASVSLPATKRSGFPFSAGMHSL